MARVINTLEEYRRYCFVTWVVPARQRAAQRLRDEEKALAKGGKRWRAYTKNGVCVATVVAEDSWDAKYKLGMRLIEDGEWFWLRVWRKDGRPVRLVEEEHVSQP